MPSGIRELLWDDWNEEHISRHRVSPGEVEEVCFADPWVLRGRQGTRTVFGQTIGGRYLLVLLGNRGNGLFYPVTARDLTDTERKRYQQERHR